MEQLSSRPNVRARRCDAQRAAAERNDPSQVATRSLSRPAPTRIMIHKGTKGPLPAVAWRLRGLGAAGAERHERALCPLGPEPEVATSRIRAPGRGGPARCCQRQMPPCWRGLCVGGGPGGLEPPANSDCCALQAAGCRPEGRRPERLPACKRPYAGLCGSYRIIPDAKYGPGSLASARTFHCEHDGSLSSPTAVMRS
jgi:hypothetical protein